MDINIKNLENTFKETSNCLGELKQMILEMMNVEEEERRKKKDLKLLNKQSVKLITKQTKIDMKIQELLVEKEEIEETREALHFKKLEMLSRNRLNKYIQQNIL